MGRRSKDALNTPGRSPFQGFLKNCPENLAKKTRFNVLSSVRAIGGNQLRVTDSGRAGSLASHTAQAFVDIRLGFFHLHISFEDFPH